MPLAPRCSVRTFNSSHAACLGISLVVNTFKLKVEFEPQHRWRFKEYLCDTASHRIRSLSLPSLAWFLMTRTLGSDERSDPSSSGTKQRSTRHWQNRTAACTNVVLVKLLCCFGNTCLQLTLLNDDIANGVLHDAVHRHRQGVLYCQNLGAWGPCQHLLEDAGIPRNRVKMADRSQGISTELNYV